MTQPPLAVEAAIVRCLVSVPRTLNELAIQLKAFSIDEIQQGLRNLRDGGTVACTGRRWYLRDLVRAQLVKAQEPKDAPTLQEIYDHERKSS